MEIQKVDDIGYEQFIKEFYEPGVAVVLKNASKVWKANGLFTPEYFRKNFGDRTTKVDGKDYTMQEFLNLIENSTKENPAPYPCKYNILTQLPELLQLIFPLGMNYAVPNWFESWIFPKIISGSSVELFLGGPGGKFPYAHIDFYHTDAWITQLYGRKNFVVFPRGQDDFMYPQKDAPLVSDVNIFNPDYEKHPKFRNATPLIVTVEQGETIFVPAGIWHTSESLSPSLSVIFDQLNKKNYNAWLKDVWDIKKNEPRKIRTLAMMIYFGLGANMLCRIGDRLGIKRHIGPVETK